ncbi:MAG: lysozyme inhibitor LprI family protein [Sulfuriferula sp.]
MNKLILTIIGWFALVMTAQAASFDCGKVVTKVEKLVCANPEISKLDDTLGKAYQTEAAGLVVNPDGSDFSRIVNADNSTTVYYQDGQGDVSTWQYSAGNQPAWALAA